MKKRSPSRDAFFNPRILFGITLSSVGVFLTLLALSINSSSTAVAAGAKTSNGLTVIQSYYNDVSPALRDMEAWPVQRVQEREAAENPKISTGLHKDAPDTVVQRQTLLGQLAPSIPLPILNFNGIPFPGVSCNCAPPDTNGEPGATQYVQMVNTAYQVFDKATGASILGPNSISSLFAGFPGVCATGFGDPVVVYDQLANRWLISQFAGSSIPTDECIAVSTTSDATGTYNRYGFHIGSNFFDYEKLSVWPDAYYMSANIFNSSGTAYLGPQGYAMDRTKMLAGLPATIIIGPILGASFPPFLPADLDGSILPPTNAPNSFVLWPDTGTYRIYHFVVGVPFGTGSSFTFFGSSPSALFTAICPFTRACVPQLGQTSGNNLDAIGDRPMFRSAYRTFADGHESLVGNFTVSSGGVAGVRWYELRGVTAGPVTTFQESTYQPDTTWRFQGSTAMDKQGNMALGYSASSAAIFPQVRYTGRLATDPLNTLPQGEATMFAGTGSQSDTVNRWGDYSDMTVDPVDDCTFWYTTEYYATTSSFNWRTRIGNFKFDTCGAVADTVTITKAQYAISRSQLTVIATDSDPAAVLTVKVTSSGEILGTMGTRGDGNYRLKASGISNPLNVTVTSNLGGSDSADVVAR